MKLKSCPACLSKKIAFSFKSKKKDYSIRGYKYYNCSSCGSYFLNPIPSNKAINYFYNNKMLNTAINPTKKEISKKWLSKDRFNEDHQQYIVPLRKYIRHGKLLDYGCGSGWFVHHASINGFDASGIDFDKSNIDAGRQVFSGNFIQGDVKTLKNLKKHSFDVISCFSILEHLQDPSSFLKIISKLLKPKGIVMIVIPTVDSLMFRFLQSSYYWFMAPYHINLFSYKGINSLLSRNRFSILTKKEIKQNWCWTKAVVDKLGMRKEYENWRKRSEFITFDIEIDRIFDQIAVSLKASSAILLIVQKK